MPLPLTFDAAREKRIAKLDEAFAKLRAIVVDPQWTNDMYPPYKQALENVGHEIGSLRRLNAAEQEHK